MKKVKLEKMRQKGKKKPLSQDAEDGFYVAKSDGYNRMVVIVIDKKVITDFHNQLGDHYHYYNATPISKKEAKDLCLDEINYLEITIGKSPLDIAKFFLNGTKNFYQKTFE